MRYINGVKIEKGVPSPPYQRHGKWIKVLKVMALGDSFLVKTRGVSNCITNCAKQAGMAVTCRLQEDGQIRVWLVKK